MAGDGVRIKIKEPIGDNFRWWLELSDNGYREKWKFFCRKS